MRLLSAPARWLILVLAAAGCSGDRPPPMGATPAAPPILVPVLVQDPAAPVDPERAPAVAGEVAAFLSRSGLAIRVGPTLELTDPRRAGTLVDFTEASAPCDAVTRALGLGSHQGQILLVFGGHISSTRALRQLYGVSCGGRAEDCRAPADAPGTVLVDQLDGDEIDLATVAAHELGHVLGLRHPYEPDCGGAMAPEGADNLMALERDMSGAGLDLGTVGLPTLQLTPDQRRTIRGSVS